ncbi:MAG: NAD(P)-binding protein [Nitrososphaerota archaeon]
MQDYAKLMMDFSILGGGWAGAIFALELKRNFPSSDIVILEKSSRTGGLLRSEIINNHVFDIGGSHIIFSSNENILNQILLQLKGNFIKHMRKSFILLDYTFVPYPFENGIFVLPLEERAEALISLIEAIISRKSDWRPRTLKDWAYNFFGKYIAEKYLIPYNLKIWKRNIDDIDIDWLFTPGRVPIADWRSVVKSAIGIPTVGYAEQYFFYYPSYGGIQTLFNFVINEAKKLGVNIINNFKVTEIRRSGEEWIINGKLRARNLISTIPINEIVKAMNAPSDIIKASEKLDYNKLLVTGVALKKQAPDQHWIYVPDPKIILHRYAWISNYSPKNAPEKRSTLITEVTFPSNVKVNIEESVNRIITDLKYLNILSDEEILFTKAWLHEYGYPIHKADTKKARKKILQWLNEQGIISIGRWGSWRYLNMDKVYEDILKSVQSREFRKINSVR